jgi:hypothetical protein
LTVFWKEPSLNSVKPYFRALTLTLELARITDDNGREYPSSFVLHDWKCQKYQTSSIQMTRRTYSIPARVKRFLIKSLSALPNLLRRRKSV